jgi:hypothetical protein
LTQTFTAWQPAAGALDSILNAGIDLFLHCPVFGKATGHESLLRTPLIYSILKEKLRHPSLGPVRKMGVLILDSISPIESSLAI